MSFIRFNGYDCWFADCVSCCAPMIGIHDPLIRDCCHECGGESHYARMRARQRAEAGLKEPRAVFSGIETLYGPEVRW